MTDGVMGRQYRCSTCGKTETERSSYLQGHVIFINRGGRPRTYELCTACGERILRMLEGHDPQPIKSCLTCSHYLGVHTSRYGFDEYVCDIPKGDEPEPGGWEGDCVRWEDSGKPPQYGKQYRPQEVDQ